ncbi:MAG: TetR/AcrR family transcriptional regulator [Verrucomicrobiota bacterium]|nr:TetR/AcrR family transcriptional regulator [Verrucomicrobiota bacterium]MEE2988758.1 TetR/AcrR family transcriptional regulator [Verrucomicrobiota bacterium]
MIATIKSNYSVSDKTRQKILSATGKVFAQGGYRAMTLRQVTREAKVNLAAVNYHFGSKLNLMRALLCDRFEPINQQRHLLLDQQIEAHAPDPVPLSVIFDTLFRPLFTDISCASDNDTSLIQIIGRALTEPAEFMRGLHKEFFADISKRFINEIHRSCPELSLELVQYRFFLSVSTMIGTVIEQVRLETISDGKLNGKNLDIILSELTTFVVAGFQQR